MDTDVERIHLYYYDFINTTAYFPYKPGRPGKGAGSLAGGERSEPPEYCNKRMRLGRGAGAPATPAGVRIVIPILSGASLRSPPANFLSPRWGGIRCHICEPMY